MTELERIEALDKDMLVPTDICKYLMNKLNIDRMMQVMSEILSDKYDAQVIMTAHRKEPADIGKE